MGDISLSQAQSVLDAAVAKATEIGALSQPGGPLYNIEVSNGGLITFPGGIPLRDGGGVIGAVGVSGSTVEDDHAVAEAGANALG
jgi:uncharacterized protein GlcG (DUF336 family)